MYEYRVVATDAGQPRRTADGQLRVEVIDVDDQLPHFTLPEYLFHVPENRPTGQSQDWINGPKNLDFQLFKKKNFKNLKNPHFSFLRFLIWL